MYLFEHTDETGDAASAERTVTDETLTDAVSVERMAADVALTDAADGDTVAESTEEPLTDVTDSGMDDIANGEYVTFDMFDGTRMDVNHWGNVLLDGVREISMDEIDRVDSSEKNKEDASVSYTTHEDYYLDSNYTLWVNMGNTSPKTTYQMVVILPQNVGTDWNSTDLYVPGKYPAEFCIQHALHGASHNVCKFYHRSSSLCISDVCGGAPEWNG